MVWYFPERKSILKQSIEAKKRFVRKTFGQKVTPRLEDAEKLSRVNGILVKLWNRAVEQCETWLSVEKGSPERRSITPISLNFWLTPVRNGDTDIKSVSVVLAREMLRRLAGAFSSYFELKKKGDFKARLPRIKDPDKSFITLTWVKGSFDIEGNTLSASIGGRQKVVFLLRDYIQSKLKELPSEAFVAQVSVSLRDGEYWANFVCNIPRMEIVEPKKMLAIDLGSGDIAITTSTGKEYTVKARRPDKKWRKEIFSLEARTKLCKKGSRAYKRRMKARRVMHNKSQHQHTDHQRKFAHWIVRQGMAIVVGKMRTRLGLSRSAGTPDQHWGVQNTGYAFRLLIFLKEKAMEYGLSVIELPDPQRKGEKDNPLSKFRASRDLLKQGCDTLKITCAQEFEWEDVIKSW